jgi:hypothetical protein
MTNSDTKARAIALIRGLKAGTVQRRGGELSGYRLIEAREAAARRSSRARALVPIAASRFVEAGNRRREAEGAALDAAELWRDLAQDRAAARRYAHRQKW